MKVEFQRVTDGMFRGGTKAYTTCGYWWWERPNNKGTLHIEIRKMPSIRHEIAVWGHELIEVSWCWLRGITTEACDLFDDWFECQYLLGNVPKTMEGGFHRDCPYRTGHVLGFIWEWVWIHATFGSFDAYDRACNEAMGLP